MTGRGGRASDAAGGPARHVPVLAREVVDALAPRSGGFYCDGTFGAGGYTRALLAAQAGCRVIAMDRDPTAIAAGQRLVAEMAGRLVLVEGRFGDLDVLCESHGFSPLDGVALDIGAAGGGNTRVLRDLGWRAIALEYGDEGAGVAHERGLPTLRGDATALPVADGSVDLVVAFDVLEHIEDDEAAVTQVFRALRPGGRYVVAVPCDPRLWSAHDEAVGQVVLKIKHAVLTQVFVIVSPHPRKRAQQDARGKDQMDALP